LIQGSSASHKRKLQIEKDAFWNREYKANATRKTDVSVLPYIIVPIETLPFTVTKEKELLSIHNNLRRLAAEPILNLTGISNTELKLKYGVANITFLMQCDENFTLLIKTILKWGSYLCDRNQWKEAAVVLEYGIQIKSDIGKNYTLLAEIYKSLGDTDKINDLIQTAESLNTLSKGVIVTALKEIQMS
jgi:tetratricopeptide (TPR) repeat protein